MFSRRSFLTRLAAGAAAALAATQLDPDKLLWIPGQKTFFLPPEKRLVHGTEAVSELSRREQTTIADAIERKTGIQNPARYRLSNNAGHFEFDDRWTMLKANGKTVTIDEAARYHATLFQRRNVEYMTDAEQRQAAAMAAQIRSRQKSGIDIAAKAMESASGYQTILRKDETWDR